MKILQVMKWLSSKDNTGGKIRSTRLGKALSSFAEVDIVGFCPHDESISGNEDHLSHYGARYPLRSGTLIRRSMKIFSGWAGGLSLRSARFFDPSCLQFADNIFKENCYDAIQVEELPLMSQLTALPSELPVIFSTHNVESQLSPKLFRHQNLLLKLLASMEKTRTAREEEKAIARAHACLAVSKNDRDSLKALDPGGGTPIYVLPNCADDRFGPSAEPVLHKEILFVGCLGWRPNAHGILWFMNEVLPHLKKHVPDCVIRIIGSEINPSLNRKLTEQGLLVNRDVPDILPYLQNARLMFVPLKIGGGSRIKIVEAWAAGLPVVTTSIGVDGLEFHPGDDVLMTDEPKAFALYIQKVLESYDLYMNLRSRGLTRSKGLKWSNLAGRLEEIYASI